MKARFLAILVVLGMVCGCSKDDSPEPKMSIVGAAQKGPFIQGSNIDLLELDKHLIQTGKTFKTEIWNNLGQFEVQDIKLKSPFVEIVADGYYYNEVTGQLSESKLMLKSLADITDKPGINVNIMTHIAIGRIKNLMSSGQDFKVAKQTAENELLDFFKISESAVGDFESLDISAEESKNGILIAISVIFQGSRSVAELSQLLADFKIDFESDGKIDNKSIMFELVSSAVFTNHAVVRDNLQKQLKFLGVKTAVPEFEKYIESFVGNYGAAYSVTFPDTGEFGDNLLAMPSDFEVKEGVEYSLAVEFPDDFELAVSLEITERGSIEGYVDEARKINWEDIPLDGKLATAKVTGGSADMPVSFTGGGPGINMKLNVYQTQPQERLLGTRYYSMKYKK